MDGSVFLTCHTGRCFPEGHAPAVGAPKQPTLYYVNRLAIDIYKHTHGATRAPIDYKPHIVTPSSS